MAGVKGRSGGWNKKTLRQHLESGTYRPARHGRVPPELQHLADMGRGRVVPFAAPPAARVADSPPRGPVPRPPAIVRADPEALAFWKRNAKYVHALGTLDALSAVAFGLVAIHFSDYQRLSTDLDENGYHYTIRGVMRLRPEVKLATRALTDFLKSGQEFGLTPLGRAVHGLDASNLGNPA